MAALVVAPLLAASGAQQQQGCGGASFASPAGQLVGSAGERLVDFAVDPELGQRVWVTDGWSILTSADGLCTSQVAWSLDDEAGPTGLGSASSSVMALAVPDGRGAASRLYALVQDATTTGAASRFRLVVTEDAGATWELRGDGLPPVALAGEAERCGDDQPCDLVVGGDLDTVYVRFSTVGGTTLYASTDGGRTFSQRAAGLAYATEEGEVRPRGHVLTDVAADPLVPGVLWGTGSVDGPASSDDGGATFTRYPALNRFVLPLEDIRHVDVANSGAGLGVVFVGEDASGRTHATTSLDEGTTFPPGLGPLPGRATGVLLTSQYATVVATTEGLFTDGHVPGARTPGRLAGPDAGGMRRLQHAGSAAPGQPEAIWAMTDQVIRRFQVFSQTPPPQRPVAPVDLGAFDPFAVPERPDGRLVGPPAVALEPGESAVVDYFLDLPSVELPLDLWFLLDETGSMQDEFETLARGIKDIVAGIRAEGTDLQVGLASYGNGFRYHRYRKIGPVDQQFLSRLESIRTGGDGEVAYTALHQGITGTGLPRSRAGNGVRAGQSAEWRPGSVRMILHATDEELYAEPEGPTVDEAIAALQSAGARHLGLVALEPRNPGSVAADWQPMRDLSAATGAFAPPGGIDCDNDGITDVPAGEPVVCHLSPASTTGLQEQVPIIPDMSDVILRMLAAMPREAPVQLHLGGDGGLGAPTPLVTAVRFRNAGAVQQLDLRRPLKVPVQALVTCPEATPGVTGRALLTATVGTRVVAGTGLAVTCGVRPEVPASAALAPPAVAVAAAQAPAAPPAPIQAPATAQGAAQANAVSSANSAVPQAGAAAAQQEQRQHQVASLGREDGRQPGIAYEFTARRRSEPVGVTMVGAVAMTAAVGALARRRQRAGVPARQRIHRG